MSLNNKLTKENGTAILQAMKEVGCHSDKKYCEDHAKDASEEIQAACTQVLDVYSSLYDANEYYNKFVLSSIFLNSLSYVMHFFQLLKSMHPLGEGFSFYLGNYSITGICTPTRTPTST